MIRRYFGKKFHLSDILSVVGGEKMDLFKTFWVAQHCCKSWAANFNMESFPQKKTLEPLRPVKWA